MTPCAGPSRSLRPARSKKHVPPTHCKVEQAQLHDAKQPHRETCAHHQSCPGCSGITKHQRIKQNQCKQICTRTYTAFTHPTTKRQSCIQTSNRCAQTERSLSLCSCLHSILCWVAEEKEAATLIDLSPLRAASHASMPWVVDTRCMQPH